MLITIDGQAPSQKNSKQIFRNSRTGAPFITSNSRVKAWQQSAVLQLRQYARADDRPVWVYYTFHVKDNRRRDIDNMIASVNDALVAAGVIKDDSWQYLTIGLGDAKIDKDNPRTELRIFTKDEL